MFLNVLLIAACPKTERFYIQSPLLIHLIKKTLKSFSKKPLGIKIKELKQEFQGKQAEHE